MIKNLKKIWSILTNIEKRKIIYTSFIQILTGILDMLSVVSIFPFLLVLSSTESFTDNYYINYIYSNLNLEKNNFIILIGIFSLFVVVINQLVKMYSIWLSVKVGMDIWKNFHLRMYEYYLKQNYSYHLSMNSNSIIEKLQVRINAAVAGVITPLFMLVGNFSTIFFVFIVLMYAEPIITLSILIIISIFYITIYNKLKKKLDYYGEIGPEFSQKSFKLISDSINGIKEIKINHNELNYINLFNPLATQYSGSVVKKTIYSALPGGLIEMLVFLIAIPMLLLFQSKFDNFLYLIPTIGLFVISFRKVFPSIQIIYQYITHMRFYEPSFKAIYDDLKNAFKYHIPDNKNVANTSKLNFDEKIKFENISFKYERSKSSIISNVNFEIRKGSIIGICGSSGAGKSTIIDLMLGLLEPSSGNIYIDDKKLNKDNINFWQRKIGYVPQMGFLSDDSILQNICFANNKSNIDHEKVAISAKLACISDFIENDLPEKYNTLIGERGIRISGGQRQRICIARALYSEPDIIFFDEATSALDGITEKNVLNSVLKFSTNRTVIIVAHRLSTLQNCDDIFFMEDGKISDSGTYNYLKENNEKFRQMERINENNGK